MISAFECFQRAAKCAEMAASADSEADRVFLSDAARFWKTAGEQATKEEAVLPGAEVRRPAA